MRNFDAIVVGCGAMGSSVTHDLSKRGLKTLDLEKFSSNHRNGSYHGKTRMIRTAYFDPIYVELIRRAWWLWRDLEKESGKRLITLSGVLHLGNADSRILSRMVQASKENGLSYEVLHPMEIRERFEVFDPADDEMGIYEPAAGFLAPEECISVRTNLAAGLGAEIHYDEALLKWRRDGDRIRVSTAKESYSADKIIFASGPWLREMITDIEVPVRCERQVVFWFRPKGKGRSFRAESMPAFGWQASDSPPDYYGFPDVGDGVKIGRHHGGEFPPSPEGLRPVDGADEAPIRRFLQRHIPFADGAVVSSETCVYTNTPDYDFIIDSHPKEKDAILICACSGGGFKYSGVIGELVGDLVVGIKPIVDISGFRLDRFKENYRWTRDEPRH